MSRVSDASRNARAWAAAATCRDDDPETFFDEQSTGAALASCRSCPVRGQCLTEALDAEGSLKAGGRFGIYGGLSPEARADLAKERVAAAEAAAAAALAATPPRWRGRQLTPCGTRAAYRRHHRRGEAPCGACKEAERQSRHERSARAEMAAA